MRDLQLPGRSVVHGINGAAASSHPLSTLAALDILRAGGNAVDAAIAACAVQCVVEPMSTGIGGDCFVLLQKAGEGEVVGLNGSGHAPVGLSADYLLDQGLDAIELRSVHAITVPGAIDAWCRLSADHGQLGIDRALAPAIDYAEQGWAVTPRVAHDWGRLAEPMSKDANSKRIFLKDGRAPTAGERYRLPELAETLKAIAALGRAGFYEGAAADDMVTYLKSVGGTHELDDFAAQACDYVTPIRTKYRDVEMLEIPPNGQGVTALIMLNILQGFDLAGLDPAGVERLHLAIEAQRLAYDARDTYVADPRQAEVPVDMLLSSQFADGLRAKIDPKRAMTDLGNGAGPVYRDTVYLTVVDRDRNACSFINSLFFPFGACLTAPESGVIFQNRGAGFRVEPGHPNCVAPRKRPLHTIIPGMALKDDRCFMSYGVMGGGFQPVGHAHVLTNVVDYGMDMQEALDAARVFHLSGRVDVERGLDDGVLDGLAALGHQVGRPEMPWGGGQGIQIDWDNGTLAAGSDPRKDGCALAY